MIVQLHNTMRAVVAILPLVPRTMVIRIAVLAISTKATHELE